MILGGYDPAPSPTVFDINKVGDPSQNPKSINVGDRPPSFAPKPNFVQKAVTKGVKFVSPF